MLIPTPSRHTGTPEHDVQNTRVLDGPQMSHVSLLPLFIPLNATHNPFNRFSALTRPCSGTHLSIPHIGMEPVGKYRRPIGSSYSVQQQGFRVVILSSLVYIKNTGPLLHRLL